MRAYIFVAFTYALLLGITAYVAYVLRPLPVRPPEAGSFEGQLQQAISAADTVLLNRMASEEAQLALPDGRTTQGRQPFVNALSGFLQQQAPVQFDWWDFKDGKAVANLQGQQGTFRMEFVIQSGKLAQLKCRRT